MKDRINPCIHYVAKGFTCNKGFVNVDISKCKNCPKYQPHKCNKKKESIKKKKQKDIDRHDNWKNY